MYAKIEPMDQATLFNPLVQFKTALFPWPTHCRYCCLALSHRNMLTPLCDTGMGQGVQISPVKEKTHFKTRKPRRNRLYFADDILKCIVLMEMYEFRLQFHWSLFLRVKLTILNYLNQWWLDSWRVFAPQRVKWILVVSNAVFWMQFQHHTMGLLPDSKIRGCACAGNAGNVFPATAG